MTAITGNALPLRPVYDGYFADPFVWQHEGIYYAIGTGAREACGHTAGKIFPLLRSTDFEHWHLLGDALIAPEPELGDTFWAPAVAFSDGTFYLYYSVGHADKCHQLRVARSATPEGPYKDAGKTLVDPGLTPFAIDPHPFRDSDGRWYFFYACDFLDCSESERAGTALMGCAMKNMTEMDDRQQVILRARSDWQRFENPRQMYGRTWDWHTLEGPCVVSHENRYYCFYSGGRWENDTYGVDYGISQSVLGPYSDKGNETGARVLRTVPGQLVGPGHNSWIVGPDGSDYLVFHAWNEQMTARRMFVQRLRWTDAGPKCELDCGTFERRGQFTPLESRVNEAKVLTGGEV
ncbi:MAG TPA: glycoside hydrolase family 43 protein [Patescibacteria group bacterium]|nr:glycoside hydrolase family 43 protein [Patescibacteria group bacterium]